MRTAILCILVCLQMMCAAALADILVVYPDGHGPYPTIQDALDAAAPADTVHLADGTFTGPGNRDLDYNAKALLVTSQSGETELCIIDCEGSEADPHRGFIFQSGETADARMERVTIRGGYLSGSYPDGAGGAILCVGTQPTIRHCIFMSNHAEQGGGIYTWGYNNTIADCIFIENTSGSSAGALTLGASTGAVDHCVFARNTAPVAASLIAVGSTVTVSHCTFVCNESQFGNSIISGQSSHTVVLNCISAFGGLGSAIDCSMDGTIELSCCDIYGNAGGNWVGCIAGQYGINGNISEDPLFCDLPNGDFSLAADSPCAPFSPPNPECDLIGFAGIGCAAQDVTAPVVQRGDVRLALEPNPCIIGTTILLSAPITQGVRFHLVIYDASGRTIRQWIPAASPGGTLRTAWDGTDQSGQAVASGVYFVRASMGGASATQPLLLVR
ncbi:MAG: T9SS type A sorting domain-containing protein [Candidatus Eisenbacteria sp.]|nr:T9SS type A sorting domain-containing protein [Candidatus Eisenbacteria bacterium]